MRRMQDVRPTRVELVGGMTVLTVLAAVAVSRPGGPQPTYAEPAFNTPAALGAASTVIRPETLPVASADLNSPIAESDTFTSTR